MENTEDIRWIQRFSNYNKALAKLNNAIAYINHNFSDDDNSEEKDHLGNILNDILRHGLIHSFECTYELAWNIMKDYAMYQGIVAVGGSRDATREALQLHIISEGKVWMEMIASRNTSFQIHNEETTHEIFTKIIDEYQPAFMAFQKTMEEKRSGI